jgi:hypothetical protein
MKRHTLIFGLLAACVPADATPKATTADSAPPVPPPAPSAAAAETELLIPRSVGGDKGNYYLIESSRKGTTISALNKRVGPSGTGYTRTETNCKTGLMRELGYTEDSIDSMKIEPTKWFELIAGSSKSDMAVFLCARAKMPLRPEQLH